MSSEFDVEGMIEMVKKMRARGVDADVMGVTPEQLRAAYAEYVRPVELKPGDLVQWKKGMKNRSFPGEGVPLVVMDVLESPVYDSESNSGNSLFREPLTLKAGLIDSRDGEFMVFHFDGARFELYAE